MRLVSVLLFALGLAFTLSAAAAEYRWKRVLEAAPVDIEVTEITPREMQRIKRRHGSGGMPRREFRGAAKAHSGYALLYRSGGEFYCRIYLLDARDGATLIHELRHCYGWDH